MAKKRVQARDWPCCKRLDEVLKLLESRSIEAQDYVNFSASDMLDYLHKEAAQPNDHDCRILVGDTGSSPDGLALLLSSIACAEKQNSAGGEGRSLLYLISRCMLCPVNAFQFHDNNPPVSFPRNIISSVAECP